jgi:hypothetical protein
MEANLGPNPGAEEVTINLPAGSYNFTRAIAPPDDASNGDLNLTGKVRIVGKGMDLTIIDASHVDRVIAVAASAVVTLVDLRVQGGRPPDAARNGGGYGGGVLNSGNLTLTRCLVRDNQATGGSGGGGIASFQGALALVDSVVRVNTFTAAGGSGGGIYAVNTAVVISGSAINGNGAARGAGVQQSTGSLRITNSTISTNVASGGSGGLHLEDTLDAALYNVTIAANSDAMGIVTGVGIYLLNANVALSNSIVAGNFNSQGADDLYCSGNEVASNGFNIIVVPNGCGVTGSFSTDNPQLLPLAVNGGPTVTHALGSGSHALDTGNPTGCTDRFGAPLLVDQRGVERPIGGHCDLGAFEREPIGDANGDGVVNVADVFYLINYLFAVGPIPLGRANVNGVGSVDIADVFYLINYLFAGGQAPQGG